MKSKTKGSLSGTPDEPQNTMARQRNTAGEKTSRKVEIGWLHFGSNEYSQVRTNNGGGTRHTTLAKTTTVAQVMELGKDLFFLMGTPQKDQLKTSCLTSVILKWTRFLWIKLLAKCMNKLNWSYSDFTFAQKRELQQITPHLKKTICLKMKKTICLKMKKTICLKMKKTICLKMKKMSCLKMDLTQMIPSQICRIVHIHLTVTEAPRYMEIYLQQIK